MSNQPAEYAILGLLRASGGSAYGYDLMRRFTAPEELADIIRLSQSMLYQHLKKLTRLKWITVESEPQANRPTRQTCSLTPAGEAELDRWIGAPVTHTREIRLEFLVKLYLARLLEPERAVGLVRDQLAATQKWRESLEGQLLRLPETERSDPAYVRRFVLDLRVAQTETALSWLRSVESALTA